MARPTELERFEAKVMKVVDGCWLWTAGTTTGYGAFWNGKRMMKAHHYLINVPEGVHVHHTCGQPLCVNPQHLQTVHPKEHHLLHDRNYGHRCGHDEWQVRPSGTRYCKPCANKRRQERRMDMKENFR